MLTVDCFGAEPVTEPAKPPSPPAALIDRLHHLGPGDVLDIRVQGFTEYSRPVRLFADGTFDYPLLGSVAAVGLTTTELEQKMAESLKRELRRPIVAITLQEVYVPPKPKALQVTVLGATKTKGDVDLPEPRPLRTLLAQVAPTETADLANIRVRYPDGSARTVDFSRFHVTGTAENDFLLKGGEEIIVLERPEALKPATVRVTILGAVTKPGTYEAAVDATIPELLEKAGGAKPEADLERVEVQGPAHASPAVVNVERYLGGDLSAGFSARHGDTLVVPQKPLRVFVFGEVSKPGEIAVGTAERVLDVYLRAGISKEGDPARAVLIRRGKDGRAVTTPVDLNAVMKGKERSNVAMGAGDALFVPPKKQKRQGFLDYLNLLSSPIWLLRSALTGW